MCGKSVGLRVELVRCRSSTQHSAFSHLVDSMEETYWFNEKADHKTKLEHESFLLLSSVLICVQGMHTQTSHDGIWNIV